MTTTQIQPRLTYRLVSRQALRDQMRYRRTTVRELAIACGRESYKSSIGNLRSGARMTCGPHLARRLEEALGLGPGVLFMPVMTSRNFDVADHQGRRVA